jgi:hypothetical protein
LLRFSSLVLAFLLALLAVQPGSAQNPPPPALLQDLPPGQTARPADHPALLRARSTRINLAALPNPAGRGVLRLNLFPGVDLLAELERPTPASLGGQSWHGRIQGRPLSEVTLVEQAGLLSASVRLLDAYYQILPQSDGTSRVEQVDLSALPPELEPQVPTAAPLAEPLPAQPDATPADPTIDLLIVYTPAVTAAAGGANQVHNQLALRVAEMNQGYLQSGIRQQVRLVRAVQVNYTETTQPSLTSEWVRMLNEVAAHPEIVQHRNQSGADLVAMLVEENASVCGIGNVLTRGNAAGFASAAFSVVARSCLSNLTLPHELGHLMGALHDHNNASTYPPGTLFYDYAYGYQEPTGAFRTVMAYNCPNRYCPRINYWSNPAVSYNGRPTGETNWANNAAALNASAATASGFRAPAPAAWSPTNLQVLSFNATQAALKWTASAQTTLLERREPAVSDWSVLASLYGGTDNYTDTTLTCSRSYEYRLQSTANGWYSPYSNTVAVQPSCPTCTPAAALTCGSSTTASTADAKATDLIDSYPTCSDAQAAPGPEVAYSFTPDFSGQVTFQLDPTAAAQFNLYGLEPITAGCSSNDCRAWGDASLQMTVLAGRTYHVLVDGAASGDFTLTTACARFTELNYLPAITR